MSYTSCGDRPSVRCSDERLASSFYRHKEGRCTCTGGQKSSSSPRIGGMQWTFTVESTLCGTGDHGARRGSCPGRCPDLAEIALASLWLQWVSWRLLWRVPSSRRDVAERRGSCRQGLAPVKVQTAFEGRAHAVREFRSGESTRSRQHSGGSSAEHVRTVRRRFPQCRYSAGDGEAVTGVGGRDSGRCWCAEWRPDAI